MVLEQPLTQATFSDEDVDVMRHRELILKAISAILLMTLKWFKVSRKHSVSRSAIFSTILFQML